LDLNGDVVRNNVDYITAIHELHPSLGGWSLRRLQWVKSHQDNSKEYQALSDSAKLNIDANNLASAHFWSNRGRKPKAAIPQLVVHEQKVSISINGQIYPSKIY
jgi:hypothetical protein